MTKKTTREQRKVRRESLLAETRADLKRAKALGEKADRLCEEAVRRRIPVPA